MSRSTRGGFTLIELLVVITIIGMLMALLVPATNAVRSTMQRLACENNQRQVGMALLQVVNKDANQLFPGYRNVLAPNVNPSNSRVGSWVTVILPGLQQGPMYQKLRDTTVDPSTWKVPYLEVLVCPSDPPENTTVPALDYIVNCAKSDDPAFSYGDKAANGLFFDRAPLIKSGSAGAPQPIHSTLAKIVDGADNTLMVSENVNLVRLLDPTNGWGQTGLQSDASKVTKSTFGFTWYNDDKQSSGGAVSPYRKINGGRIPDKTLPTPKAYDYARPASNHNGGVNVCFASGRETWLRDDIAYYVYQQLMTPDGANADPIATNPVGQKPTAANTYLLTDGDYRQ